MAEVPLILLLLFFRHYTLVSLFRGAKDIAPAQIKSFHMWRKLPFLEQLLQHLIFTGPPFNRRQSFQTSFTVVLQCLKPSIF